MNYLSNALIKVTMFFITRLVMVVGKKSANAFRQNQICVGKMNGFIEEMIEGQKVIKVFNHEAHAKEEIVRLSKDFEGTLSDGECIKLIGIHRNTYYKYKKELVEDRA